MFIISGTRLVCEYKPLISEVESETRIPAEKSKTNFHTLYTALMQPGGVSKTAIEKVVAV
jgi:hypothetical protein